MKKLISVLLSTATVFSLALLPVSATSIPEVESAAILEQPQLTNEDAHVLTMEMFNEAFTRDDVINILAADKANGMASTYAYVPVTVTEAEIQEFYAKIEAIVARAPALSYYFSNYYWWTRDDDDYYDDLISLKLVPTSVMKNTNDKEEALAYIYGFICHFALDSTCHGYIDEKIAQSGVSHTEIEVEFDRSLMIEDGKDPVRQDLTKHIVPSMENAEVIAHFFPGTEPKQVKKALKGMIRNNQLLLAPSGLKRKMIYAILRLSGNYKEMHGLLVNFKANPACKDSTEKLHQM